MLDRRGGGETSVRGARQQHKVAGRTTHTPGRRLRHVLECRLQHKAPRRRRRAYSIVGGFVTCRGTPRIRPLKRRQEEQRSSGRLKIVVGGVRPSPAPPCNSLRPCPRRVPAAVRSSQLLPSHHKRQERRPICGLTLLLILHDHKVKSGRPCNK